MIHAGNLGSGRSLEKLLSQCFSREATCRPCVDTQLYVIEYYFFRDIIIKVNKI